MTQPQLETQLGQVTDAFRELCNGLTANQLNWKPNAETWSLAEILDHLVTVNESYCPVVEQLRAGTYRAGFLGRFGWARRFFGNFILKSVEPTRQRKMRTFPIWEPRTSDLGGDVFARFEKHQADFARFAAGCADLVAGGAVVSSPANRTIVYTLEKAFEIIVEHEWRHLEQAREVRAILP